MKSEFRAHVRPAHPSAPANTQSPVVDHFARILLEEGEKYAARVAPAQTIMPAPVPDVMPRTGLVARAWQSLCDVALTAFLCGAAFLLPDDDTTCLPYPPYVPLCDLERFHAEGKAKVKTATTGDRMRARAQRLHSWAIAVGMGPALLAALVVGGMGREHSPRALGLESFLCAVAVICLIIGFAMDNRAGRLAREAWGKK